MDTNIDILNGHSTGVASVIISTDTLDSSVPSNGLIPNGIAPSAKLYSSAYVTPGIDPGYADALRTTQYLAKLFPFNNGDHIRAINHSWLKDDTALGMLDGNSLLTLGMDWMAERFDVLNIIAGAEGGVGTTVPSDNYNGITVAYSGKNGQFWREAGNQNDVLVSGQRAFVDLLAPGEGVEIGTLSGTEEVRDGTSIAAPHVTGAVALLNQFADFQINASAARWNSDDPRTHEVMKAVLLNSANRKAGVQGSQRDVISRDDSGNYKWEDSAAFTDDTVTLDPEMGAGHLNTGRALTQFRPGEYDVGENIPAIGWDYHETGGTGTQLRYPFAMEVSEWVSITLAWDRQITKNGGLDNTYDPSNMFTGSDLNDLNLFLVPVGSTDLMGDAVAKSISDYDNVELIFNNIAAGMYEIGGN